MEITSSNAGYLGDLIFVLAVGVFGLNHLGCLQHYQEYLGLSLALANDGSVTESLQHTEIWLESLVPALD